MGLWFRKKEKAPEPTPQKQASPSGPEKTEKDHAQPRVEEKRLDQESFVPVPPPTGLKSFKLPPDNTDAPASESSGDAEPGSDKEMPPATEAPSAASSTPSRPSEPVQPVVRNPSEPPGSQTDSGISQPPQNKEQAVKPLLKPIQSKPRIQVADKTDVPVPKTETVAADLPAVTRTDPKALYYQLMNGLYDVIFVLDDDGHIMDCNIRSEEIFGYSADDVWNLPIEKIVYGMNSRMFSLLKKNLTNKRHILIDARCFRSTGTSFLAEIGVSTVQLTRSQNVVFAIRNVERRKNSAEELRKYRAVIDTLPNPAFACDLHGQFEVMNPPVLKALGMVDEMEAQKKHFGEMLPDMVDCFQKAVRGEAIHETKELTRPDGSVCNMELRLRPMHKGEEITGVAGTLTFS